MPMAQNGHSKLVLLMQRGGSCHRSGVSAAVSQARSSVGNHSLPVLNSPCHLTWTQYFSCLPSLACSAMLLFDVKHIPHSSPGELQCSEWQSNLNQVPRRAFDLDDRTVSNNSFLF